MRNLVVILVLLISIPALGQRKRQTDTDAATTYTEGVVYALPRTGFQIQVETVKELFEPGPYAQYAEQLLGIQNVRNQPSVTWSIRDIKLKAFSEPDPSRVYKAMGEVASMISLTPSGCLAGINAVNDETSVSDNKTNQFIPTSINNRKADFSIWNHSPVYIQGDSATNFRPTRVSAEDKAVEAARRILECRNTRFYMAAGLMDEFHPDGDAYKVSLRELDRIEKGYMSLFTGKTTFEKHEFGIDFLPASASEKGEVVFRFSEEAGVLPASDLSGKPVMIRVEPDKTLISEYDGLAASENPNAGASGIYYRMPVMTTIHVIYEMNNIATTRSLMPQFGQVAPIPEELLFGDHRILIHPETGAVKSITRD